MAKKKAAKTPEDGQASRATKAPAKPAARRRKSKGVRYSDEQKATIVQFVRDHDQKQGRGGQSAAVKKFGVTALTISKWLKGGGKGGKKKAVRKAASSPVGSPAGSVAQKLQRMLAIEKQLEGLRAEFATIKDDL